jgi:VWFA-related protein
MRPVVPQLLAAAVLAGQAASQQPLPPASAEIVQLDVVVTRPDGKPVLGLAQRDFAVLEDRKPQALTHFSFVEARGRTSAAEPAGASSAPGRSLVILVDDLHIAQGNVDVIKGVLARLVAERLGPDDSVALLTTSSPDGARPLLRDTAAIQEQIERLAFKLATAAPVASADMTPAQAELVLRGDRSALRLAGRKLMDQPGSTLTDATSPRAVVESSSGAGSGGGAGAISASPQAQEAAAEREAERQARAVLNDALRQSSFTLRVLEGVLRSLAPLPGRKLCLLVSDGFLVGLATSEERTTDLRGVVDAAARSGAVVYALDSQGLVGSAPDASAAGSAAPPGLQSNVDRQTIQLFRTTLDMLAGDTGGLRIAAATAFDGGLERMLADNDGYYLMAYAPANQKRDGKFRRIEVKVAGHPEYVVRTRRGYLAPDDKAPRSGAVAAEPAPARGLGETEARALLETAQDASAIPLTLAADFVDLPPEGSQAIVRAHLDVTALGAEALALDVVGGVYDGQGAAVGPVFGGHRDLPAADPARRREGLQLQQRVALPPGRYEIRLAAREAGHARLGAASRWVDVPDLKSGTLALSGLFLSRGAPGAEASGSPAGEEALSDVQALRRFKSGDTLYFQIYVYNLREEGGSDALLQAQLRQGQTALAASKPQPIKLERKDGVLLPQTNGMPLSGLAAGNYELRVVVVDRKANATASRQIDFSVE